VPRKSLDHFLTSTKASLNHQLFFPRIYALIAKECQSERDVSENEFIQAFSNEYDEISRRLDRSQIQESCSVRAILRSRRLANLFVNDKGEINLQQLPQLIEQLKNNLYSLGPNRQYDTKRQKHILSVLEKLLASKELVQLLKKVDRPLSNRLAEDLIRQTLRIPPSVALTDAHARRAVLSAWLYLLRQNVGSCFATAPAEMIQSEQPEIFLKDMVDLISLGRLKRTFEGVEYSVPISDTWGNGDLKKPILLRLSSQGLTPEIWCSPGLIAAFEAIHLLDKHKPIKDKSRQLQEWIEPIIKQKCYYDSFCLTSAEEIIRLILLQSLGISDQQLKEYEARPKEMIQSQLLIEPITDMKRRSTSGDKCLHFYQQFNTAKNAFKALADNPLLKAWEFTLASFSETKLEFTQWNLYASLGMQPNEPGGIGQWIQYTIQNKIDYINKQIQEIQYDCEVAFTQVKTLESRLQHTSEKEMQWVKMDYQNRLNEYHILEEQKNALQSQINALIRLFETLYQSYLELFKEYFQEVYDAEMQEVKSNPFDDSPAGFRLLYKHGRNNPAQWTRIRNLNDFINSLSAFFIATEHQIGSMLEKGMEKNLSDVVSAIILHIKTNEFQESAFYRMAAAHNFPLVENPLQHLDQIEKKPWAYTSGGTMNTLVNCYYGIGNKPKEQEKWVESAMELLVFIVDTLKQIPNNLMAPFLSGKLSSMLMQSPTHAFLLKPMNIPFTEGWQNDEFTYTSLRDRFVSPAETFVRHILLNDEMIHHLVMILIEKVPENFQYRFRSVLSQLHGPLTPLFFRDALLEAMHSDRGLQYNKKPVLHEDEIDSVLFTHLPFFPVYELEYRLKEILLLLPGMDQEKINDIMNYLELIPLSRTSSIMSAWQLQEVCKALICLREMKTTSAYDYHLHVRLAAQKLGFAMPFPIIFADTNWVKEEFGFVVNPGTARLELWRVDYTGSVGYPMSVWKEWVNGTRPDIKWGIYVKPSEYGQL
jgi:hypothetical protein